MNDYIKIEKAENGFVVTVCEMDPQEGPNDKTYTYKTLEEAVSEIPAIFSVMNEGEDKEKEAVKKDINEKNIGTTKSDNMSQGY